MKFDFLFNGLHRAGLSRYLYGRKQGQLTVLSIHRISPEYDFFWQPVHPSSFEALLRYLSRNYNLTSFSALAQTESYKPGNRPDLILSFDDGYHDFYSYALPLLKKFRVPANHNIVNACANQNHQIWTQRMNTIFGHCMKHELGLQLDTGEELLSITGTSSRWMPFYLSVYRKMLTLPNEIRIQWIAEKENLYGVRCEERMMNWTEIKDCDANGIEIGSHTYHHDVLSTITNQEALQKEVLSSVTEISYQLNKQVTVLALPNGEGHPKIREIAGEAGINYVLYVGEKLNPAKAIYSKAVQDIYRINMVEESLGRMILRTESFHTNIKRNV